MSAWEGFSFGPREFDIHLCIAETHQPHHDQAFTNFFILLGAITGLGYNSLVSDERSTDWLRDCDCRSWYQRESGTLVRIGRCVHAQNALLGGKAESSNILMAENWG